MVQVERQALTSYIHQHLLSKLASAEYAPGSHLKATIIAVELDVGRKTIRKVIEPFIDEGWVQVDRNRYPNAVETPGHRGSQLLPKPRIMGACLACLPPAGTTFSADFCRSLALVICLRRLGRGK